MNLQHLGKYLQALCYFSVFSAGTPLLAATFTVTNVLDSGAGSLRQAIIDANANGSGSTITFATSGTIPLASSLPGIGSNIVAIHTAGNLVTINGGNLFSGFFITPTSATALTIDNTLSFSGMASIGGAGGSGSGNGGGGGLGAGGGLFVGGNATVTIQGLSFTNCAAQGGAGGNATGVGNTGGGGGGMNTGAGGAPTATTGGTGGTGFTGSGGVGGTAGVAGGAGTGTSGGGGGGSNALGGGSAFGGGSGGGGLSANAGASGFGGGGGGGLAAVSFGFGGGPGGFGGSSGNGGGGGGGLGGAIFIQNGGTLNIQDSFSLSGNTATGGALGIGNAAGGAGVAGKGLSADLFLASGGTVSFFPSGTLTISSNINSDLGVGGGSGGGLHMGGTGTLVLSGTNTYTGTTFFDAGTISVSSNSNLGSTSAANGLQFNGGTLEITPGSFSSSRQVSFSGPGTISPDNLVSATLSGPIQGSGNITIGGLGTLILAPLSTSNTFSGSVTINSGSTLQLSNAFGFPVSAVDVIDNGLLAFNNLLLVVRPDNISGSGALSMQGLGTLELQGTNTYTGATSILGSSGVLQIDTAASFPSTNTSGVINNSFFVFNHPTGTATVAGPISGTGALTMQGGAPAILALSGNNSYTGVTTISSGTLQINAFNSFPSLNTSGIVNSGSLVFNNPTGVAIVIGPISGTGTLSMQGAGVVALQATLSSPNTYSGPTTITAGTLRIDTAYSLPSGANVTVTSPGTLAFNDPVSAVALVSGNITGGGHLLMQGAGTAELSGTNSYGSLTISLGTVQIDNAVSLPAGIPVTGTAGTLSLNMTGAATVNNPITGGVAVDVINTGVITLTGANTYSGGTGIFGGGTIVGTDLGTGSVSFNNGTWSISSPLTFSPPVSFTGPGSGTINTNGNAITFNGVVSGSGPFSITGGGTLTLSTATNTFSGSTTSSGITAGTTLQIASAASFPSTNNGSWTNNGALLFNYASGTATVGASIAGTGTLTLQGGGNAALSGINTYTGVTTISAGTLQLGSSTALPSLSDVVNNGVLNFNYASGTATISGLISGTGSVTLTNSGTLVLANASNSYGGGTSISGNGIVDVTDDGQLGLSGTSVTLNSGELNVSAGPTTFSRPFVLNGPGILSVGAGTATLDSSSPISGAGSFQKLGSGTLILQGTNSYLGNTTITAGTLQIDHIASWPSSSPKITDNGILNFNQTGSLSVSQQITGTGSVAMINSGTLILAPGNTYQLGTTISGGGTVQATADSALGSSSGPLAFNNGTLDIPVGTTSYVSSRSVSLAGAGIISVDDPAGIATFNGTISGSNPLTKEGPGTLILTGNNAAYTGDTTISAGTLQINNATSYQSSGTVTDNGSFVFKNNTGIANVGGVISGTGSLTMSGLGTLTLGSANSYSGPTNVSAGTLLISAQDGLSPNSSAVNITGNGTLAFNNSAPVTVGNNISGTGNLTMQGTSTLILTGSNTGLTGKTTISSGTLQVSNSGSLPASSQIIDNGILSLDYTGTNTLNGVISGTGSVQLINNGILTLGGANTYSGGTLISGGGTIQGLNLGMGPITFNNGTWDITSNYTSLTQGIILTGPGTIGVDNPNIAILGSISGTGSFTKAGTGTLILEGANSFGPLTISAGTLQFNIPSSVILTAGIVDNGSLVFNTSALVQMQGDITGSGGLTIQGTGTLELSGVNSYMGSTTISSGTLQVDNFNSLPPGTPSTVITDNGILNFNYASGSNTLASQIVGTGSVNLINSGVLALSNASNSYSGGTNISGGGTIQWSNDGQLGASSGSVTLNGGTLDITGGIPLSARPFFLLGTGPNTIDTNGNTVVLSGNITGTGPLTKQGSGTLELQGSNNFGSSTNPITIAAGTLQIDNAASFPLGTPVIDNGLLLFNQASTINLIGNLTGTGALTMQGSGSLVLFGANTYAGLTTVSNGTLQIANANSLPSGGNVDILSPGALMFTHAGTATAAGMISGNGTLTMAGSGTLILSGNNSGFTGTTSILSGVLEIDNVLSLSSSANILDNGSLNFNYAGSDTITGLISGTGSVKLISNGTLLLSNTSNSYTGGTSVSGGGILQIQNNSQLGAANSNLTLNNGTVRALNSLTMGRPIVLAGLGDFNTSTFNLTLGGNISGTGPLTKLGAGTLTLSGLNSFAGPLNINAGTVDVASAGGIPTTSNVVNSGALLFTHSGTATLNGMINGSGTLTMAGAGDLILGGANTYTGLTTVQTGTLTVDGSVTSDVFVAVGATLAGTGTIFGNVTIDGSSAPGNSIGTITGNTFLFNASSSYDLEFNNTTADLIVATTSATIDGGKVILMPLGFTQPMVASYPIINSPSITVNTPFVLVNPLTRFDFTLQYDPTQVLLVPGTPVPFHVIVPTGTASGAVAKCFDALLAQNPSSVASVTSVLELQTSSELVHSFNQMQPSHLNSIAFAEENVAERVRQIYTDHFFEQRAISCPETQSYRLWVAPFVERVRQHGGSNSPGYLERFVGFSAAFDYRTKEDWMVTTGFSCAAANLNVPHGRTKANFVTYAASLGASWTPASWFFDLIGSYLYSKAHAERKMHFSSSFTPSADKVDLTAKHSQFSNQALGHFGTGYVFKIKASSCSSVNIYPFANVDYQYIPQDSYKEHGAHGLDLKVSSKKYDYLRPEGGLGMGYKGCFKSLEVMFDLSASYIHEFRFAGKETRAEFDDSTGCTFTTRGLLPENNLVSPEARLRLASPRNGFSILLGYHGEFGKHFSMNAGEMEFRIAF